MYFSVTSANCSTSPVSRSVFERRTDFTKPPNSAPMTSSGTESDLIDSTAMPSRPMRLTASAPSTRSRMPWSTCLNTAHLAAGNLGEPAFEARDLLADGRIELRELAADGVVRRVALRSEERRVGEERRFRG